MFYGRQWCQRAACDLPIGQHTRQTRPPTGLRGWSFPCCPLFLVDMPSPTTPAKRAEPSSGYRSTRASLPPVQAGSAFASCLSGPPRRSHMLQPADLQTALRRLVSPKLRLLRYLHTRWDSYPAGTTFTGAGLSPAGTTDLCTAHLDHRSRLVQLPDGVSGKDTHPMSSLRCCYSQRFPPFRRARRRMPRANRCRAGDRPPAAATPRRRR